MVTTALRHAANATVDTISIVSTDLAKVARDLPSAYSDYVASNSSSVSTVESSLRSLTYLLPGARLHDTEIASESVHTFVQLLSIYHDHLLKNRARNLALSPTLLKARNIKAQQPKPSLHSRYTTFWSSSSSLYTKIATLLKVAQYTELLWEMIARRRGGERTRWRVVVLLESLKAICRLLLLKLTNSRPLVNPPLPLREDFAPVEDDGSEEEFNQEQLRGDEFDVRTALGDAGVPTPPLSDSGKPSSLSTTEPFCMPRTGYTLPTLPTTDSVSTYLFDHVLTADDVKPAKQLLHRLSTLRGQAAETMYILRPVIYAVLMQRVARTYGYEGSKWKRHWTPWLIGLSIEYFARQLAKQDLSSHAPGGSRNALSALERDEFKKRNWSLAWWGMRGAFYENITKKWIHGAASSLKGKPLLDLVGTVVEDYEYLWSSYYFSTSTIAAPATTYNLLSKIQEVSTTSSAARACNARLSLSKPPVWRHSRSLMKKSAHRACKPASEKECETIERGNARRGSIIVISDDSSDQDSEEEENLRSRFDRVTASGFSGHFGSDQDSQKTKGSTSQTESHGGSVAVASLEPKLSKSVTEHSELFYQSRPNTEHESREAAADHPDLNLYLSYLDTADGRAQLNMIEDAFTQAAQSLDAFTAHLGRHKIRHEAVAADLEELDLRIASVASSDTSYHQYVEREGLREAAAFIRHDLADSSLYLTNADGKVSALESRVDACRDLRFCWRRLWSIHEDLDRPGSSNVSPLVNQLWKTHGLGYWVVSGIRNAETRLEHADYDIRASDAVWGMMMDSDRGRDREV